MTGSKIKVAIVTGVMTLFGVGVGGLWPYFIASEERAWTKDNVAAAFAGEVEGIILEQRVKMRWPRDLLTALKDKTKADYWDPTGIKPEKDFVIFNALADKIGMLGPCLSRKLARLYKLKSFDIKLETFLVSGAYMKLTRPDKIVWMTSYVDLIERVEQEGNNTLSALEGGKCETQTK